jgi:branched-chain amino acid transport system permease protein
MFDVLFLQFLNGLDKGSAYALIALGLTLVFGTLGVVNFAHGALFMLGAFCAVAFRRFLTMETVTLDPTKLSPWGQPLEVREPLVQAWFGDFGATLVNYSVPVPSNTRDVAGRYRDGTRLNQAFLQASTC